MAGSRASDAPSAGPRRAIVWLLVALALRAAPVVAVAGTPLALLPTPLHTGSSAPPPASLERHAGLPNFGVVSDQLYRGAQPSDSAFAKLKALGIAIVVNLRHEGGRIARERTLVQDLGMRYVSIPWRGHDDPKTGQVAQFLRLLQDNPGLKVFVHCERGAERTGVMVACYRISGEQWPPERALAEMEAFGFRRRFAHLTRFVREFPAIMARDPLLMIRP